MCPASAPAPLVQTAPLTQLQDKSGPMDISKNASQPQIHKCFNSGEQGHIIPHYLNLRKQQIQSTTLAEFDLKCLVAEAVAAAMNAWKVAKKAEEAKEDFLAGQW